MAKAKIQAPKKRKNAGEYSVLPIVLPYSIYYKISEISLEKKKTKGAIVRLALSEYLKGV